MKLFVSSMIATVTMASVALGQSRAAAQSAPSQFAVDGSIGFVAPDFGSASLGFDLMGAFEWHPRSTLPVAFRGEIGWDYFGYGTPYPGYSASADIVRIDVDALYDIPVHWTTKLQPYLLGGLGIYILSTNFSCPTIDNVLCGAGGSTTNLGINLGGGLRYPFAPSLSGFFELRWHEDFTGSGTAFFPFQFGVRYAFPR
jgi:opacity protein-like surface antigen